MAFSWCNIYHIILVHVSIMAFGIFVWQLVQTKNKALHYWPYVKGNHWWMIDFPSQRSSNFERVRLQVISLWYGHYCTHAIHSTDFVHKFHNASVPYPTMQYYVTEMGTFLWQNGALWDICLIHCGIWDGEGLNGCFTHWSQGDPALILNA